VVGVVGRERRELAWFLAPAACPGSWRSNPLRREWCCRRQREAPLLSDSKTAFRLAGEAEGTLAQSEHDGWTAEMRHRRIGRRLVSAEDQAGVVGTGGAFFLSATTGDWTDHENPWGPPRFFTSVA